MPAFTFSSDILTSTAIYSQLFARQDEEDGPDPSSKWGVDREDPGGDDPDSEDYMPIPAAQQAPGNSSARAPLREWSDDDDDECRILDVLDPTPLSFTLPASSTPANLEDEALDVAPIAGVRGKRAAAENKTTTLRKKRRKVGRKPAPQVEG